jgi:tRNA-splicing endonuclease subunit Sen2
MTSTAPAPAKKPPMMKRPNYSLLHANPLPLTIQALPPLIPHNPFSLLQILYTYLFCRTPCQPEPSYVGFFNSATRSVHVVDARSIQAFWNSGFFGKGSLSRSEPTWISRRRRALGVIGRDENLTAEEITERRRQERKQFKLERARAEKGRIQNQLVQEGKIELSGDSVSLQPDAAADESDVGNTTPALVAPTQEEEKIVTDKPVAFVEDLEHLQLTQEEAFFLMYGLGALKVTVGPEGNVCLLAMLLGCSFHVHSRSNTPDRKQLMSAMPCVCSENTRTFLPLGTRPSCSQMTPSCLTMWFTTTSAHWAGW